MHKKTISARWRTPSLLIIGAMKAGTTSLYFDLQQIPRLSFPLGKEPNILAEAADELTAFERYTTIYRGIQEGAFLVDASTAYSKLPDYPDVASLAAKVCENARIVYMVRDPVKRALSHYRHDFMLGLESRSIDEALLNGPRYINYSDYGYQLNSWIENFGQESVRVIKMETYAADRKRTLESLCAWLGLPTPEKWRGLDKVFNKADAKRELPHLLERVLASALFQKKVRPLFSPRMRVALKQIFPASKASPRVEPDYRTIAHLESILHPRYEDFCHRNAALFLIR